MDLRTLRLAIASAISEATEARRRSNPSQVAAYAPSSLLPSAS